MTDFDVDKDGTVWIWDGQKDRMLHYAADGSFSGDMKPDFDARLFKCIGSDNFLFELASWDKSRSGGNELLLSDRMLDVRNTFIEYGEYVDPNYEFISMGFADAGSSIFYHQPIDDYVYEIVDGIPVKRYRFDFGKRTVPDEYKTDVERHLGDLESCTTLVKTICVGEHYAIGCVRDGGKNKDFIMDRTSSCVYLQDSRHEGLHLVSITGGKAIFVCFAGGSCPFLPDNVLASADSGSDVLIIIDLAGLSSFMSENN
ncbi:MAG: 6-bladed beta-propeller [Bacteroidales bacterium]|nr:6-bladed beta-propeller [Bacteroidales bacterium]